jgi:hypothetical protein
MKGKRLFAGVFGVGHGAAFHKQGLNLHSDGRALPQPKGAKGLSPEPSGG